MSNEDRELRRVTLQLVTEVDRGIDIAMRELRAGQMMAARETLAVARALLPSLETATQRLGRGDPA